MKVQRIDFSDILGEIARLKRKTGNRKYEKGMRRWSQEEDENMLLNI